MSRLDSFIRRVSAQRDCLNMVAGMVAHVPGPVLELGLGNGRTFDHLRDLMPERDIFVFDRRVAAHPACIPDDDHMVLGDIFETLPTALDRTGAPAALVHTDIGTGDEGSNARIAAFLGKTLPAMVAPGGIIASDQDLNPPGWSRLPLPEGVQPDRYHIFRLD
ncbi:MAG: class I SAM-dependent methyltransferase [Rhodospirillales bacterium]|nr:class I SAM-dependent methyltransferase [Rhodospirillales bacterium]